MKRKGGRQIRGEAAQPPPQQQFTPPPQQQATPPPQGFGQQQAPPPQAFGQQAPPQNQAPPTNSFAPPVDMVVPNLGMSRAAPNFGQQAPPHGDPSMDQPPPQTRTPETPPVSDYAMARGAPPFGAPPGTQAAAKWPNANHAEMAAKRLPLWKLQASSSPTTATKPKGDSITYQNNVAPPPATNPLSKLGLPTQPVDEAVLRAEWEAQEAAKRNPRRRFERGRAVRGVPGRGGGKEGRVRRGGGGEQGGVRGGGDGTANHAGAADTATIQCGCASTRRQTVGRTEPASSSA